MPEVFHARRFVEFSDTDMAGIVHFAVFFRYMESAEHAFLRSLGLSVFQKLEAGGALSFPRVNATCDYHAPARCEDELDIAVTVKRLGGKSITYGFAVSRDEALLATGAMTCVCCQIEAGSAPKPVAVPEPIAAKLRPYLAV